MSSSSSSSHATVTYTYVSSNTDLPSWGIPLLEAYESDPEAPLSPVHAPEDPEYLAPSDNDIAPVEDQPLPALPIALLPGYIADLESIEDNFEEDPEMDLMDYGDDEKEEEPCKDKEKEVHLAPTDSSLFVPDFIPSAEETKTFETDSLPQPLMSTSTEALIVEYASSPTLASPSPSPLSPLSSILPLIPSLSLLLPSPTCMDIILEANMTLQKRVRFTTPSHRFEMGESSAAATARQTGLALTREEVNERMIVLAATNRHMIILRVGARLHRLRSEHYMLRSEYRRDKGLTMVTD
nr:hypothetical protein [Tanacetum cinerariifolium]